MNNNNNKTPQVKTIARNGHNVARNGHTDFMKVPPQAREIEMAVLGAIMLEKGALGEAEAILKHEYFYEERHQKMFEVCQELDRAGKKIDILTVTEALRTKGWLDEAGGSLTAYYVTVCTNAVVSSANILDHSKIILQFWVQREVIKIGMQAHSDGYDRSIDPFALLDDLDSKIFALQNFIHGIISKPYHQLVAERAYQIIKNDGKQPPGLLSRYRSLDDILLCFFPGQLYVIAARASMGKSALMVDLMENLSSQGHPVGILELETSDDAYIDRHIANKTGINTLALKMGGLDQSEQQSVQEKATEIINQPIQADFISEINVNVIRSKARAWKKKYGLKCLVINYLQIITPTDKDERLMRERQVSNITLGLLNLAKELQIPVIAFAQLSRAVLNRAGNRPNLGDLRESGGIEMHARTVIFIHRPEAYGDPTDELGNPLPPGTAELIVAKNNEGKLGTAFLIMDKTTSKFRDRDLGPTWHAIDTEKF